MILYIHFYWSSDNSIQSFKFIVVILEVFSISEKYSQLLQIAAQSNIENKFISVFLYHFNLSTSGEIQFAFAFCLENSTFNTTFDFCKMTFK